MTYDIFKSLNNKLLRLVKGRNKSHTITQFQWNWDVLERQVLSSSISSVVIT